ncbi:serine protease family protein [Chryseobacterium aquaticum]|uniref:Peptidase S1 domain-containing protein n=1 Tax=Chryseobacterium aquaticum subsp. greenlandense TaxID=345663 RepID=A0A101CJ20_9FLAO|nr:trypsin-like peptidase domain-containing protein [Chryseobacterium aquaticum]KUJ57140.1 hypothetical protein AR686_05615 [Chryseobacterium aquaticum subsp. greenlandense]
MNEIKKIAENLIMGLPIVRSFTCQLLINQASYKQHGTGIFVNIGSKYFLFTAAHVLDDIEKIFIPMENGETLLKPGGQIIKNTINGDRENDDLDVGILVLDKDTICDLREDYCFLNENQIGLNHIPIDFHSYLVFGYPTTMSKKSISRNSFHTIPFFNFTKCVSKETYKKINRQDVFNLVVAYDRKNIPNLKSKTISFGPNLFGISGCGLWFVNPYIINEKPKLIGIMNEWSKLNKSLLIATRIDAYTEVLRKYNIIDFPESDLFSFS